MTTAGYAPVNGLDMYYEIHGTGQPLVPLHGAFSAIGTSFGKVLPDLARSRQVIGLEMQAHGHTADIDRPLSLEQMADDTVAALQHLGIERADFFGYSTGAAVALRVAIRHPDVVRRGSSARPRRPGPVPSPTRQPRPPTDDALSQRTVNRS